MSAKESPIKAVVGIAPTITKTDMTAAGKLLSDSPPFTGFTMLQKARSEDNFSPTKSAILNEIRNMNAQTTPIIRSLKTN